MSTTAQQLLEAGYARSTANDPGKLATDAELLARASLTYGGLYALAARQRPDEFATAQACLLINVDAHFVLPTDLIEIRRLQNALGKKVHLIPATELERLWHTPPCMYRTGGSIYSRLKAGDPVSNDTLTGWLLLAASTLANLTDVLDAAFPTRHTPILSNDLALYLDAKDEDRDPEQFRKLAADQAMKLAAFASEFDLDASALEFVHAPAARVPAKAGGA